MEDLEQEKQTETFTETVVREDVVTKEMPETFLHVDEMLKSEQQIKTETQLKGLKQVENKTDNEEITFTQKSDKKKAFAKKRLKVIAGVYLSILALLLVFVGINTVTLAMLNKDIRSNTETINIDTVKIEMAQTQATEPVAGEVIQPILNEPRDYNDENIELSFLDKLTILFKNLFG